MKSDDALAVKEVNLHEDIELVFDYFGNPDDSTFQLNFYYNEEIIRSKKMDSNHIKIKLRDHLDDLVFEEDNYEILIKGLVFNEKYSSVSSSTKIFSVNIPPKDCKLFITPDLGMELQDKFKISVTSC